jgi:O-antigen ligase/tetratricopeptide (TPR) repeat protein
MQSLEKFLRNFIIIGIFSVVLLVPFINSGSLFFPYVVGKAVFLRVVATLIFGAWLILVSLNKRYLPKFNWVTIIFTSFIVWILIANLFGFSFFSSFWSNFERMEGYLTLLATFFLFLVSATVIQSKRLWFKLFNFSLAAAFIMGLIALDQHAGGANRSDGLLGNPIYLAGYMLFHVFLSLFFLFEYKSKKYYVPLFYGTLTLFFITLVFITETRGAMLGLVSGLFIATLAIALKKGEKKWIKYTAFVGLFAAFSVGALFSAVVFINNYESAKNNSSLQSFYEKVEDFPGVDRFSRISLSDGDAKARFLLWEIALEGIKERPVLGMGQENFIHLFNSNYKPKLYERETWFDRTHNIFLEWGVAGGIPGMFLYIAIFISSVAVLWRKKDLNHYIKAVFSALLVAHAVQSFFVFENITSYIFFAVFVAFSVSVSTDYKSKEEVLQGPLFSKETLKWFVVPAITLIVVFFTYQVHIKSLQSNQLIIKGMTGIQCSAQLGGLPWGEQTRETHGRIRGSTCSQFLPDKLRTAFYQEGNNFTREEIASHSLSLATDIFEEAKNRSPVGRQETAEILSIQAMRAMGTAANQEVIGNLFSKAESLLIEANKISSESQVRPLVFLANFYSNVGKHDEAIKTLEEALLFAPNRQHLLILMGQKYQMKGEFEKAVDYFKKAHELEPSFKEPIFLYASSVLYLDDEERYKEIIKDIPEEELLFQDLLLEPLVKKGEVEKITEIRKKRIDFMSENYKNSQGNLENDILEKITSEYQSLIQLYYKEKDFQKALVIAEEAGERFPHLKESSGEIIREMRLEIENQ